jgi:hypothetical protein
VLVVRPNLLHLLLVFRFNLCSVGRTLVQRLGAGFLRLEKALIPLCLRIPQRLLVGHHLQ